MPEIPYTVRLAPKLLERIEKTARDRGICAAQIDPRSTRRALRWRWSASSRRADRRIKPAPQASIRFSSISPAPGSRSSTCSITRSAPKRPTRSARLRNKKPSVHAPAQEKSDMNLSRTAIRYELSSGSAAVLLRLYLRIQLLWILIWAASDLFFVWYWTGRISGPGAHEYFGRWILAWFFTQKVPLYFLSLPYRGGRATIGSMYLLSELALLSGPLVRAVVRLLQRLGSGTGDHDSRRSRLSPPPRSRGPFRGEASARPHVDPAPPARHANFAAPNCGANGRESSSPRFAFRARPSASISSSRERPGRGSRWRSARSFARSRRAASLRSWSIPSANTSPNFIDPCAET